MANLTATALIAIAIVAILFNALTWRKAYATARATGFPAFLSPIHVRDMWWLLILPIVLPVLNQLPKKWTKSWLPMTRLMDIWKTGHKPFDDVGSDSFVLSTPKGNVLWTCDPKIIHQLESTHPKFQKAVEMLKFLDIYGPSVASVEGEEWKAHRKIIMSGFTPATNSRVWHETMRETRLMMGQWSKQSDIIPVMRPWAVRLTLHVLSIVFYRKSLTWSEKVDGAGAAPAGYSLSFEQSLFTVLGRLGALLFVPRFLLSRLPVKYIRETHEAFVEFTKYIRELIADTRAKPQGTASKKDQSILEAVVAASSSADLLNGDPPLPEASVLGNLFFIFSAGHETAGNTMSFALNLLALHPEYQLKIQEDLDRQRAQRQQEDWTVEREYQALQNGWLGAVLKETLLLYSVVQWLPRVATADIDVVDSKGESHTVPKDTMVILNFSAAFLNPNTWLRRAMPAERRAEIHDSPAADFNPARWLPGGEAYDKTNDTEELLHFPFGQGPHVCPGRMFALVEMTAMLATVLLDHSLELVVGEETLRECEGDGTSAWEKTRDRGFKRLVDDITTNQNIELHEELPIRLVKRS